ncbi:MAG: GNAT family N-acetyltransferase [Geminicoccaceae bacterium]
MPPWREEAIHGQHARREFDCGNAALNDYLARYARQNHKTGVSKTFVAVAEDQPKHILGYYSLSAGELEFDRVPRDLTERLPRYPLPVVRLARLAVARSLQGLGLGGQLLLSAGERALAVTEQTGVVALAIDAKDASAARWYRRFGALPLLDAPLSLVLPLRTIEEALRAR